MESKRPMAQVELGAQHLLITGRGASAELSASRLRRNRKRRVVTELPVICAKKRTSTRLLQHSIDLAHRQAKRKPPSSYPFQG